MTGTTETETERAAIRASVAGGRYDEAWQLVRPRVIADDGNTPWTTARNVVRAGEAAGWTPPTGRSIRLAVLGTYEVSELCEYLRLACLALGVDAELYVAPYGQLEQELLESDTPLARFEPSHVLITPTTYDLGFPELAGDPGPLLSTAVERWTTLWSRVRRDHGARAVQHAFVVPDDTPLGHLALRLPGSRVAMVRELNRRLAETAGTDVLLIDSERLAARLGKRHWLDPRLWHAARRPFSHEALPALARETAAVLAGDLGLGARCLVLDLDNTLWGGVIGDDGIDGIAVGDGPVGEAYADFQDYVGALRERGIILAVASKNDLSTAREPFERHPGMRLRLDDFAAFVADWRRKPEQIAEIAATLGLGLQSLVFADDNPAECAEVAAALPEVSVIALDVPPSELVRRLGSSVRFESPSLSRDDAQRQRSYAARGQAEELRTTASTIEDFWRLLQMRARVRRLDPASTERAAQLTQKTNQFNLTLNRHSREDLARLRDDDSAICLTLELGDRFADHGLIGLALARPDADDPGTALVDTLLLSCRVIGRTAEAHMLSHLARAATERGFTRLRGVYVPGPRNALVADVYPRLGFVPAGAGDWTWDYDLERNGPIESVYITDEP